MARIGCGGLECVGVRLASCLRCVGFLAVTLFLGSFDGQDAARLGQFRVVFRFVLRRW